jgi:predicted AAA+ superfamily ATPase
MHCSTENIQSPIGIKTHHLHTRIKQLLAMFPVVALIGSRQCGKSTLVKQN